MRRLNFLFLLSIGWGNIYAQTDYAELEWVSKYSRPFEESPVGLAKAFTIDDYGNSYIAIDDLYYQLSDSSSHSDYVILKYDRNGNEEQVLRYTPSDSSNQVARFTVDRVGNIYIAGSAKYGCLYKILKYTYDGCLQWVTTDSSGSMFSSTLIPISLAVDESDNVYMTSAVGQTYKYNCIGKKIWEIPRDGRFNCSMVLDENANIYLLRTGRVAKYNSDGVKQWDVADEIGINGGSILLDHDGNNYVCGLGLAKYNSDGTLKWTVLHGEGYYDMVCESLDNAGNPIILGKQYNGYCDRFAVIKYDTNGTKLWEAFYAGPVPVLFDAWQGPRAICTDRFNNIYVTGSSFSENGTWDIVTIKYSPQGEQKWVMRYDNYLEDEYPPECKRERQPIAVRVDTSGNIYVAGHNLTYYNAEPWAIITLKYKQLNFLTSIKSDEKSKYQFHLYPNHPNPFNPSTVIQFSIPQRSFIDLCVYDLLGRDVAVLVNEERDSGTYETVFNGTNLSSGIYLCRLRAAPIGRQEGGFVQTRKFVLQK